MYYIDILIIFIVIYGVVMSDEDKKNNTSETKKEAKKYTDSGLDISGKKVVYEGNKPGKVVSPRLQGQNRGNITF